PDNTGTVRDKGEGKRRDDTIDPVRERVVGRIALHQIYIRPAVPGDSPPRLVEHGIGQIDGDDAPFWADGALQWREIEASATAHRRQEVAAPDLEQLDRLLPPGFQREDAAGIIALRPPAIALNETCLASARTLCHAVSPLCLATWPAPTPTALL